MTDLPLPLRPARSGRGVRTRVCGVGAMALSWLAFAGAATTADAAGPLGAAFQALPTADACTNAAGAYGCTAGRVLSGATDIVVSPDGRHAYVVAAASNHGGPDGEVDRYGAISIFDVDAVTGKLTQRAGPNGCIAETGRTDDNATCTLGARGLRNPRAVTVSRDGATVYVAGSYGAAGAIAVFTRDPQTGTLTQAAGAAGCLTAPASREDCGAARELLDPATSAATPDGVAAPAAGRARRGSGASRSLTPVAPGTGPRCRAVPPRPAE